MLLNCLLPQEAFQGRSFIADFISKTGTLRLVERTVRTEDDLQAILNNESIDILFVTFRQYAGFRPALSNHPASPAIVCLFTQKEMPEESHFQEDISLLNCGEACYEAFLNAVNKSIVSLFKSHPAANGREEKFFFIKSEYRILKIDYDDILFCEGLKDYTRIYTSKKNKPILTLQNLKTFSDRLPAKRFIRVHRSFIISLNHVESISKKDIAIGEKTIPIGNSYRNNLLDLVKHSF
jgi:hypothetical protein